MARLLAYLFDVTERFGMQTRTELILLQRTMVVVEGVQKLRPGAPVKLAGKVSVQVTVGIPINEARDLGLEILPPDVNESGVHFFPAPDGKGIRFGLAAIKGVGEGAVQAILKSIHDTEGMHELEAFKVDTKIGIGVFMSDDAKEGPLAFKEKRAPNFQMK